MHICLKKIGSVYHYAKWQLCFFSFLPGQKLFLPWQKSFLPYYPFLSSVNLWLSLRKIFGDIRKCISSLKRCSIAPNVLLSLNTNTTWNIIYATILAPNLSSVQIVVILVSISQCWIRIWSPILIFINIDVQIVIMQQNTLIGM